MIKYLEGDIFSSPAQTIVNTVNTVGVMGKGIALEFKKRYPKMFEQYKLPYSYDALEPVIDALTVETHWGKHHAAYTKNFNDLVEKAGLTG